MIQIEITTRCNYSCFYCAGRQMPQMDMPKERFDAILSTLGDGCGQVFSLQGEGEPTLHPLFWEFADQVERQGYVPYTITNGTRIDPDRFSKVFRNVGYSIDTLDPNEAEVIGRHNLKKALSNLDALIESMGASRIIVHTVHYGQDLSLLIAYLKEREVRHLIQPLQAKDDYIKTYRLPTTRQGIQSGGGSCRFLSHKLMRYFTIDGVELPCCFIKDTTGFVSEHQLRLSLSGGIVPKPCQGCRELH